VLLRLADRLLNAALVTGPGRFDPAWESSHQGQSSECVLDRPLTWAWLVPTFWYLGICRRGGNCTRDRGMQP
jgi:hypothetical protein